MEEEKKNTKETLKCVKEETEKIMNEIIEEGIQSHNVDFLYKVVDIHKDIANEEHWQDKKEEIEMMYGEYGEGGSYRTGRNYGRGSYGRRGVRGSGRGRYRGEEMMDEMMYHYGNYNEGREQYGADEETMKSFKYMLKSFKDYYKHLKQEASSQQEIQMLEDTAREMLEM